MRRLLQTAKVLVIEAHPDDADWGCYGAVQYARQVRVLCLTTGVTDDSRDRVDEARRAAEMMEFEYEQAALCTNDIDLAEAAWLIGMVVDDVEPDVILTHDLDDGHQDHVAAARATEIAVRYRECVVMSYASPSAMSFVPNVVVPISERQLQRKMAAVSEHESQRGKPYMAASVVEAAARWNGRYASTGFAEGFRWFMGHG